MDFSNNKYNLTIKKSAPVYVRIIMKSRLIKIEEWIAITFFFITALLVFVGALGRTMGHPLIVKKALGYLWLIVIILFLGLLVYLGAELTFANTQRPLGDTGLSYSFVTAAVPVGSFLMLMTCLNRLYRVFIGKEAFSLEGRDSNVI